MPELFHILLYEERIENKILCCEKIKNIIKNTDDTEIVIKIFDAFISCFYLEKEFNLKLFFILFKNIGICVAKISNDSLFESHVGPVLLFLIYREFSEQKNLLFRKYLLSIINDEV